ncbi:MAG: hypothetical protein HND48_23455 [Chloroflexi bacterium]|nr:hypothetical protein [Chloroflexota bacterium]
MLPPLTLSYPERARSLLMYRYHNLHGAREKAREAGCEGAMYPWESTDTGLETTPRWANELECARRAHPHLDGGTTNSTSAPTSPTPSCSTGAGRAMTAGFWTTARKSCSIRRCSTAAAPSGTRTPDATSCRCRSARTSITRTSTTACSPTA